VEKEPDQRLLFVLKKKKRYIPDNFTAMEEEEALK
jgi:hypothetical protein